MGKPHSIHTPRAQRAVVRSVPDTYDRCIRPEGQMGAIDVGRAREQHAAYCEALEAVGIELVRVEADAEYPDCCFVEDPVLLCGGNACMMNTGARSRRGEGVGLRPFFERWFDTVDIGPPATAEGGDVLVVESRMYVGISARTCTDGFEAIRALASVEGIECVSVKIGNLLHLKTVCSYIGGGRMLLVEGALDTSIFDDYECIYVPEAEAYAVNCLALNDRVLVAAGFPRTREIIESLGLETIPVPMSEFENGGGGLTCLSVRF